MLLVNSTLRSQEYAMHKYPDIFESATFSCRFGFRLHVSGESGIRIQNFFNPLSLANGTFLRRYESGIMWKLIRIILLSDDVTRWSPVLNREYSSTKLSFLYFLDFFLPYNVIMKIFTHIPYKKHKVPCAVSVRLRACVHRGGGPQVGEVTRLGGVTRLSI